MIYSFLMSNHPIFVRLFPPPAPTYTPPLTKDGEQTRLFHHLSLFQGWAGSGSFAES